MNCRRRTPSSIPTSQAASFPSKALAGVGVIFLRADGPACAFAQTWAGTPTNRSRTSAICSTWWPWAAWRTWCPWTPTTASSCTRAWSAFVPAAHGRGSRRSLKWPSATTARITSTDLGFILGPRLNAAGRLDDMSLGIECLLTTDIAAAREMAAQLDGMNQDRKSIEQGMQREALAQLKDLPVESMPYRLVPVRPGMAPRCDRHSGVTHEGTLLPPDHRLRRRR